MQTLSFTHNSITSNVFVYPSSQPTTRALIYLHGGGLLFGDARDLPDQHVSDLTSAGYTLFALNYPLAPECTLDNILDFLYKELTWCLSLFNTFNIQSYSVFGRSAGAYLCYRLTQMIEDSPLMPPSAAVFLYGFYSLDTKLFTTPASFYAKLPSITSKQANKLLFSDPVCSASPQQRWPLYAYARQQGAWAELLSIEDLLNTQAAKPLTIPCFFAACNQDPDVPYTQSKSLFRQTKRAKMITVFDTVHDFDANLQKPAASLTYQEAISWLNRIHDELRTGSISPLKEMVSL